MRVPRLTRRFSRGIIFTLFMILPLNKENISAAARIIKNGGLCAFPTETVYGLGGDAFNVDAVRRIFKVKNRPFSDPLIVHIAEDKDFARIADFSKLPAGALPVFERLKSAFMPGPLTLVLPKSSAVPDEVSGALGTVALRIPAREGALALIREAGGALAAPSANPFGYLSPTTAEHVEERLGGKIDLILDGGRCTVGLESTVLDLTGGAPRILREGGTSAEAIEAALGVPVLSAARHGEPPPEGSPRSPGLLKSHYAPATPLILLSEEEMRRLEYDGRAAYLFFNRAGFERWTAAHAGGRENIFILSESAGAESAAGEAAEKLFRVLHEIDGGGFSVIYAARAPESGLGRAINDRLARAAAKNIFSAGAPL